MDQVKRVRARLAELDRQQQYYFYDRLTNPKAFEILKEAGAFADVTPPEVIEGQVVHYAWPPTAYLKTVVTKIPDKVAAIVATVETENQRVLYDLADLVRQLPASLQEALVDKAIDWLDRPNIEYAWANYVAIIDRLAEDHRLTAALRLARRVLKIVPKEGLDIPSLRYHSQKAGAEFGDIAYEQILSRVIDALLPQDPRSLVSMLADLLEYALDIGAYPASNLDYSSTWAKVLTDQPLGNGVREILAYQFFEALRRISFEKVVELDWTIGRLSGRRWPLFSRMRLALVSEFGTPQQLRNQLTAADFMNLPEAERERGELLAKVFPVLEGAERRDVIKRMHTALTSVSSLRRMLKRNGVPAQDIASQIRWERDRQLWERLKPIAVFLEGVEAERYARLSEMFAIDSDLPSGLWVGPESPKALRELESLSTEEVMEYVERWRPEKERFAPSPAGLALALAPVIEKRVDDFLSSVERILGWQPLYVWHVIDTLRKHVNDPGFDVAAFVRLLSYVQTGAYRAGLYSESGQLRSIAPEEDDEELEAGSSLGITSAFAISDLLRSTVMVPSIEKDLWSILETLLTDQDPTIEEDLRRRNDAAPWNASLNSVRGAAMQAVFDYARWLYRTNGGDANPPDLRALAPYVFNALDAHLGAADPSPAVRATYGHNFVSAFAMAEAWTIEAIPKIFDDSDAGSAAWRTYLAVSQSYDATYLPLKEIYSKAIASLSQEGVSLANDDPALRGLAAHVIRIYARGFSALKDPTSLIAGFIKGATPEMMGSALRGAGLGLSASETPAEIWNRMVELYEAVLESYAVRDLADRRAALEQFGTWISAPTIDKTWALDALVRTLHFTSGRITARPTVVEWLARMSELEPVLAAAALGELATAMNAYELVTSNGPRIILSNAIASGGEAYRKAQEVDERLTQIGIHNFHDLFRRGQQPPKS